MNVKYFCTISIHTYIIYQGNISGSICETCEYVCFFFNVCAFTRTKHSDTTVHGRRWRRIFLMVFSVYHLCARKHRDRNVVHSPPPCVANQLLPLVFFFFEHPEQIKNNNINTRPPIQRDD